MRAVTTSFGIGEEFSQRKSNPSDVQPKIPGSRDFLSQPTVFHKLPPIDMRATKSGFLPDFALLLLCDKLLVDKETFELICDQPPKAYDLVSDTIRILHYEGFVELVDFSSLLRPERDIFEKMLTSDLKVPAYWHGALQESLALWRRFLREGNVESILGHYHDVKVLEFGHIANYQIAEISNLPNLTNLSDLSVDDHNIALHSEQLRDVLRSYLSHVNANILLSNSLDAAVHDWADFRPFYDQKFLSVGRTDSAAPSVAAAEQFFTVAFPEFRISDPITLVKVLRKKQVRDLRVLIQEAADGRVEFDNDFARQVLHEVVAAEQRVGRLRKIVGYATAPIGFIPGFGNFLQLGISEIVSALLERRGRRHLRWFYMLSDVSRREADKSLRF